MSERVATERPHGARTIGDILLELGFVDEDGLASAFERQRATGQPIGQVLVEVGAITRLELATALAEQWADPSSPGPRWLDDPRGPVGGAPEALGTDSSLSVAPETSGLSPRVAALETAVSELREADEGGYLSQLQEAVVELARRSAGSEAAAAELAGRVEDSAAALVRLGRIEGELADATQRLDAVAAGVEVAVHGLQSEAAGTVETVSRLAERVDEVAAGAADAAALEQLRIALETLAGRPAGDPELSDRLADVVSHIDALADSSELEALKASVADLATRPPGDPALAEALDELRLAVAEQASRPAVEQELGERVDGLAARLGELAAEQSGDPELEQRLAGLQERLDGLAAELAVRDGDAVVIAELSGSVSDLTGRVAALAAVAGAAVDAEAVEALKLALDELSGRTAVDPSIGGRIDTLVEHVALLPDGQEVQALRDAVAELSARSAGDADRAARIEELTARLDDMAALEQTHVPAATVEAIVARVEGVSSRLDELYDRPTADPAVGSQLEDVRVALADGLGRLDELAARIHEVADRGDVGPGVEDDPDAEEQRAAVVARMGRLEQAVVELAQSLPSVDAQSTDAFAARLALLERDRAATDDLERLARAVEIVRAEVHDRLSSMAAELGGFDGRLEGLTARPALEPEAEARVAELESQLEQLMHAAERGGRTVAGSTLTGDAVEDIERLRMSIERLGHTIGEQGRAIAELMRMRGGNDGVERLTSRIEALEDGGVPGSGDGDGPPAAGLGTLTRRVDDTDAALEKLLTQLERMGSSLEWRFRRLEEMVGGA